MLLLTHRLPGQRDCPFGDAVLAFGDCTVASETCEELFTPAAQNIHLALAGVDIVTNGSGSHHQVQALQIFTFSRVKLWLAGLVHSPRWLSCLLSLKLSGRDQKVVLPGSMLGVSCVNRQANAAGIAQNGSVCARRSVCQVPTPVYLYVLLLA